MTVQQPSKPWRRAVAPTAVTLLLVLWTIGVYPRSAYGDNWAIWPALVALPVAICWHLAVVVFTPGWRRFTCLISIGHLVVLVPIWFACLMLVTKDSL